MKSIIRKKNLFFLFVVCAFVLLLCEPGHADPPIPASKINGITKHEYLIKIADLPDMLQFTYGKDQYPFIYGNITNPSSQEDNRYFDLGCVVRAYNILGVKIIDARVLRYCGYINCDFYVDMDANTIRQKASEANVVIPEEMLSMIRIPLSKILFTWYYIAIYSFLAFCIVSSVFSYIFWDAYNDMRKKNRRAKSG